MRDLPLVIPCGTLGGGGTGEIKSPFTSTGVNETGSDVGSDVAVGVKVGSGVSVGTGVEVGSGVGVEVGFKVSIRAGVKVGRGVGVGVGSGVSDCFNASGFLFPPISILKTRIKHIANGSNTIMINHIK